MTWSTIIKKHSAFKGDTYDAICQIFQISYEMAGFKKLGTWEKYMNFDKETLKKVPTIKLYIMLRRNQRLNNGTDHDKFVIWFSIG